MDHEVLSKHENVNVLRDEMRDILKETKALKKKLNEIHEDVDTEAITKKTDIDSLIPRSSLSAPLDTYLAYPLKDGSNPHWNPQDFVKDHRASKVAADTTSQHFYTAERILQDVQESRNRLENNLEAVLRNREECRLYDLLKAQSVSDGDDKLRIRHTIDKKIQEISAQVQDEVSEVQKVQVSSGNQAGNIGKGRSTTPGAKATSKVTSKFNKLPIKDDTESKTKIKQKVKEGKSKPKKKITQDQKKEETKPHLQPTVPTPFDYELLASIYGQPPYHPHRSSIRPSHIQFHSPPKVKEEPPRVMHSYAGVKRTETFINQDPHLSSPPERQKYYFQPTMNHSEMAKNIILPSTGELVPVAVPLGKPRQDPTLRMPIPSTVAPRNLPPALEDKGTSPMSEQVEEHEPDNLTIQKTGDALNVAVITMTASEPTGKKTPIKRHRQKKRKHLTVQTLPAIDIETSSEQWSILSSQSELDAQGEQKIPQEVSVQPPAREEYDEFENYLAVQDIGPDQQESSSRSEKQESRDGFEFEGDLRVDDRDYHGPPFPPRHSQMAHEQEPAVLKSTKSIEEKAQEWVEQELLARIVSEINQPAQDPTLKVTQDVSFESEASSVSYEGEDWISNVLGLDGMQLFIDAGIPVNRGLISALVKDVISERLDILFGYPKEAKQETQPEVQPPEERPPSVVSTPLATPVYTPPESDASGLKTPSASASASELSDESLGQPRFDETVVPEEKDEEPSEQEAMAEHDQVPTPVHTPPRQTSPVTTPVNPATPEASETSEPLKIYSGSPVITPEVSHQDELSKTQEDFERTITEEEPELSEDKELTREDLSVPPFVLKPIPEIVQVKVVPSSPSISFTVSSTTTPGASTTEGISEGEHLRPDKVQTGQYSEGEFPLSPGQALSPVEELEEVMPAGKGGRRDFKALLNGVLGKPWLGADEKSAEKRDASEASTLRGTEELQEDTLNGISLSEGELIPKSDPLLKILQTIRSPVEVRGVNAGGVSPRQREEPKSRSEGEISIGEQRRMIESMAKPGAAGGFRGRELSSGEILLNGTENGRYRPSLSVGEVRAHGRPSTDQPTSNSVFLSDKEEDISEITGDDQNKHLASNDKPDVQLPRTIVVKSKDPDLGDDDDEKALNLMSDSPVKGRKYDAELLPASAEESVEKVILDTSNQPSHPTKIQLTIPSVASEDSADYITDTLDYDNICPGELSPVSERDSL